MNFQLLDKLIHARRLPDDGRLPRKKLRDLFRTLEQLRAMRATATAAELGAIDEQIRCYERILEDGRQPGTTAEA
jgi:hypothetical protein